MKTPTLLLSVWRAGSVTLSGRTASTAYGPNQTAVTPGMFLRF
jgi:hypothetical protein